jgi:branched-chain amino acid transport system permease protein
MKLVNFAHGEFLMVGMYVAVTLAGVALPAGLFGIYWVAIPTALVMSAVGVIFYVVLLARAAKFGETPQILLTIGLSIGMQGAAQVLQGSNFILIPNPIQGNALHAGPITLTLGPLVAFVVALAVAAAMAGVLRFTRYGKATRAVAENIETAEMLGIDARKIFITTSAIAVGLVGLGGALLIPYQYTFPNVGQSFVVIAFLAIVIAGLGNVLGSVLGGILLGMVQSLTASYFDLSLSTAALYLIFILVLIGRPQGLFTRRARTI